MTVDISASRPLERPDAVLLVDAATWTIVQWSEAATELFAYTADEAIGLTVETLLPECSRLTSGGECQGRLAGRTKTDQGLSLNVSIVRMALPGQPQAYVLLVLQDLGWRQWAEARLSESEERYRALYEDNPTMYLTVRQDGLICSVNRFGAELLGYTPEEMEGQSLSMLFPDPDMAQVEQQLALAVSQFGMAVRWELRKKKKGGEIIWVRDIARAIHSPTGNTELLLVCEEITALKTLEATLTTQNQRLEHLDTMKNQFVGAVSHELRTPLTSIRGFAEFLEDEVGGALNETQHDFVRQIHANTLRLQRLVDDLLDFSRLEVGEFKLQLERTDLAARTREFVEGLRPSVEGAGMHLEVDAPHAPVWVVMDALRVAQVLTNLIDNAVKFSPPGGTIRVGLTAEEHQARCEVADEGPGIGPGDQSRIFDRFVQLDGGDTRRKGGAGLGLSIARGIVEAHGGRIGVTSHEGEGSTFFFYLPSMGPPGAAP